MSIRRPRRFVAMALISAGVLLAGTTAGYMVYKWYATNKLDSLVYVRDPTSTSGQPTDGETLEELRDEATSSLPPGPSGTEASPDPASLELYPGEALAFNAWADPWSAEPPSTTAQELMEGFLPVGQFEIGLMVEMPPATRIGIPAIGLEADVQELVIEDIGDSRQYETPKHVVGHIPETANPGEGGNNWLFGHLQSPLRNEGSVFRKLPMIPDMLRRGELVYVVLDGPGGSYLYDLYETTVVHQDDLRLYDSDDTLVTLVTCVPALKYDHRLLVSGKLIGFKPLT